MRASEFQRAVADEFGPVYGASLVKDLVIGALGDRTSAEALAAGEPPKRVWLELCREAGVPEERRHGVGRLDPRRR